MLQHTLSLTMQLIVRTCSIILDRRKTPHILPFPLTDLYSFNQEIKSTSHQAVKITLFIQHLLFYYNHKARKSFLILRNILYFIIQMPLMLLTSISLSHSFCASRTQCLMEKNFPKNYFSMKMVPGKRYRQMTADQANKLAINRIRSRRLKKFEELIFRNTYGFGK